VRCAFSLVALIATMAGTTFGATLVVRPDGSGEYPTIQSAIDAAVDGDVIKLTNGTFTGDGNRDLDFLGKAITVRSHSGVPALCTLDCEGSAAQPHRGFIFRSDEGAESVLHGLTIAGGHAEFGGAILGEDGAPTLDTCVFSDNQASLGGAIYCGEFRPTISGCEFLDNIATSYGGAVFGNSGSNPRFTHCTFIRNSAGYKGGGAYCKYMVPIITNCTFADNAAPRGAALFYEGLWIELENTIIAFSTEGEAIDCIYTIEDPVVACCDITGNAGGDWVGCLDGLGTQNGNFALDPLFCDREDGNVTVAGNSPCLPGNHPDGYSCDLIGALPEGCAPLALPDLVGVGFRCFLIGDAAEPDPPDSVIVAGIFSNAGQLPAEFFHARIEVEGCVAFWGDTQPFGPLAAGESDTIFAGPFEVVSTECTAGLFLDPYEQVAESDEENNVLQDLACSLVGSPDAFTRPAEAGLLVLRVHPNPSGDAVRLGFSAPLVPTPLLSVYDISGRRIWSHRSTSPEGSVVWPGRDGAGNPASAGTYFVTLRGGGETVTRQVRLVR